MSSQAINDFLTKQIFIERNIVTYRSLSRELKIHVNVAKNELATYHALAPFESQASKSAATYLLSGEALAPQARSYEDEDVNMDDEDEISEDGDSDGDGDEVSRTRVMLVNERDLEVAKTQFARLDSVHVYSLAPSPIRDAGLLCTLTDAIRLIDGKQGSAIASVVGKVVGKNIQIKAVPTKGKASAQPIAGPSKPKLANAAIPVTKAMEKATIKDPMKKDDVTKDVKISAKPTGKLDFSRAKAKEMKKAAPKEPTKAETKVEQKKEDVPMGFMTKGTKSDKSSLKPGTDTRGKKRKSPMVMSDSEDDGDSSARSKPVAPPGENVRVKKRTVLSDDEDEDDIPKPVRRPRKSARASEPVDSEAENEARALMDVDDDKVVRITRDTPVITKDEGEDEDEGIDVDQDVEMSDNTVPKPKPRKRLEKKVIPIGSNGLKKKRVIKSRMMTDAKGYMVTEDYSSYESADENEEPEPKPKKKTKGKPVAKARKEEEEDSTSTPPPPKLKPTKVKAPAKSTKTRTAQPKQKSLAGFFTAPKVKN